MLDIGPASDGTIPVIMEERLTQMCAWLKINGEAIYGTKPYTSDRQWSSGKVPALKGGEYQTGYDVNELVKPVNNGNAYIEMFFTRKGNDLYCIMPNYHPFINIRGFKLPGGSNLEVLGVSKKISWKQSGSDVTVDLSKLNPADLHEKVFTLKITNAWGSENASDVSRP